RALVEAMLLCQWNAVAPPDWLWDALHRIAENAWAGKSPGRRGRANSVRARTLENAAHRLRHDAAVYWLKRLAAEKARAREERARLKALAPEEREAIVGGLPNKPRLAGRYPLTRDGAFRAALAMVRRADRSATRASLEQSYNRLRNRRSEER